MQPTIDLESLRGRAQDALKKLAGVSGEELAEAKGLVEELRNAREYERMGRLAEAVSRRDPDDPKNRRLYAQCLIETGHATVAIDVLRVLARRLPQVTPSAPRRRVCSGAPTSRSSSTPPTSPPPRRATR